MMLFRVHITTSVSRLLALGILWAIGAVLLVLDYHWVFREGLSYAQFWLGILFCMIPAFFLILDNNFSREGKVFVLFMWGITLYFPKVLRSPDFLNFQDEILHFQTSKLIYESGTLNINPTIFPVSMYYPGLELLAVSMKSITNLSLFSTAILLVGLIHSLLLVFIFLLFEKITSSTQIAALGALIYTSNLNYFTFSSFFSYESLGIFLAALLALLLSEKSYKANDTLFFSFLSLLTLSALVITHHFSSYMVLLFLIILVLVRFCKNLVSKRSIDKKSYLNFTLLTATLIFGWVMYVASISVEYLGGILTDRIKRIVEFSIFTGNRELFWQSPLPNYEVFINKYLYIPLILLFSWIGIYFIHREKKLPNTFVYALITYGPVLFFFSLPLILTGSADVAYRSWTFFFVGVSFVVAYATNRMIRQRKFLIKTFAFIAVILILVSGISLGDNPSGRFLGSVNLVSGPTAMTSDVIYASNWFEEEIGRYNNILGDLTIQWVFGGYGVQNITTSEAWSIFFPKTINNTVINILKIHNIEYIIVDKRITEFLGRSGHYFSWMEPYVEGHPGYGSIQPLPKECIDKFDDGIFLSRMYSNGNITIYKINIKKLP